MGEFEVKVLNYFDKESSIVEVYYDRVQWVELFSKKGKLVVQFYSHPNKEFWEFSCEEAMKILEQAKSKLLESFNKENSLFSEISINEQGQKILEQILNDPKRELLETMEGGFKIYSSSGRGAQFNKDGSFRGFIERQYE